MLVLMPVTFHAVAEELRWFMARPTSAFTVTGSGDACLASGASVTLSRLDDADDATGIAGSRIDTHLAAGKIVELTGLIETTGSATNAALWMSAEGPAHAGHVFQTTEPYPVATGSAPVMRRIRITVPADAMSVVVGVALKGGGTARVTHLNLVYREEPTHVGAGVLLQQAVGELRENALAAGNVDWDTFLHDAQSHLAQGQPASAAYPAIRDAVHRLDDGHSRFIDADSAWAEALNDGTHFAPDVHLLPGGIGYVALPGFTGPADAETRYIDTIASAMSRLAPEVRHGWVIDLRQDSGGTMWPMLAAVHSLLGDGEIGAFRKPGADDAHWYAGVGLSMGAKPNTLDLSASPVAVLMGPHTSSAGEAVAVAFHGRPATRSFGAPTSGQANSNETMVLKDGSLLVVKAFIDVDRNGVAFGKQVIPDDQIDDAAALDSATAWLAQPHPL
ncbi:S41 family peptidase [Luteibacter aegosomatissinici]|uniref:S41 family peptidase n=1 Tax=Luteibacter aegosomatissinici TaxID=2911539 RepID=UPI001FFA1B66|nr:S41 family peptidase [Luteibacter aegosomatissinici]UPG95392.1 S41 family peptidase [Luteibacter aegosomatissinici]